MTTAVAFMLGFAILWLVIALLRIANPIFGITGKVIYWPIHIVRKVLAGGHCEEHNQYFERVPDCGGQAFHEYGMGSNMCYACFAEARDKLSMTRHEEETQREELEESLATNPQGRARETIKASLWAQIPSRELTEIIHSSNPGTYPLVYELATRHGVAPSIIQEIITEESVRRRVVETEIRNQQRREVDPAFDAGFVLAEKMAEENAIRLQGTGVMRQTLTQTIEVEEPKFRKITIHA